MRQTLARLFIFFSYICLLFSSCVGTRIVTIKDSQYAGHNYGKVMVHFESDLETKLVGEKKLAKSLNQNSSAEFIPSQNLIFYGKKYAGGGLRKILKENGIQAILLVINTGSESQIVNTLVPTFSTNTSDSSGIIRSNKGKQYTVNFSTTSTTIGSTVMGIPSYTHKYELSLYDLKSGSHVWRGEAIVPDSTSSHIRTTSSFFRNISKSVKESGFIK